jgi:hypothetical protein
MQFINMNCITPMKIHHVLVKMCGSHWLSRKQVWVWCNTFDHGRADVDDKQKTWHCKISTTDDNLYCANNLMREEIRLSKWTSPEKLTFHYILCITFSTTSWITKKCGHAGCQETSHIIFLGFWVFTQCLQAEDIPEILVGYIFISQPHLYTM